MPSISIPANVARVLNGSSGPEKAFFSIATGVGFRFFMIKMRNNFAQNKQDFFGEKNRIRDWGFRIGDLNK
jgi:hypothetical protein